LRQALQLGFTEVNVCGPDKPLVCRDRRRVYVMMPLDQESSLPPSPGMTRIASANHAEVRPTPPPERSRVPQRLRVVHPDAHPDTHPTPERSTETMPNPHSNGPEPSGKTDLANGRPEPGPSIADLIGEAEALRTSLQDALVRLSRLLAGLKHHHRQSRAMRAAVQSLRLLKLDA
jgi:hypothetical protein